MTTLEAILTWVMVIVVISGVAFGAYLLVFDRYDSCEASKYSTYDYNECRAEIHDQDLQEAHHW